MSWFYDNYGEFLGYRIGLQTRKILYSKKNKFQTIKIFETRDWGRILTIDKTIQTTERDEFVYHEMISHVPIFLHPDPQNVLIIGGGDGGVLKEVLRHKIKKAVLVEIDKDIIESSKKFLKKIHEDSFYDKRAEIIVGDGIKYVKNQKNVFDVIIIDCTDPVGPAKDLFSKEFYNNTNTALTENGILVTQSGGVFIHEDELLNSFKKISRVFSKTAIYLAPIPTYPATLWSFVIASKNVDLIKQSQSEIERRYNLIKNNFKFYNPEVHKASFALPEFIKKYLKDETKIS